ncbi:hypothetical protein BH10ACI2_BH10ACI2_04220 [soil metagenome]
MADGSQNDLKNSSAFKSAAWTKLAPAWKITSDLWGSALDVRNLDKEYLPKLKNEPNEKYAERKGNSVFSNEFRGTIEKLAGMVFRSNPQPEGVHPEIEALLPDIDLCGNSFWAWNFDSFMKFLRDGNGFIYVDAPPLKQEVQAKVDAGETPTLADREGDRPFWVYYSASQVINYRFTRVGSRAVMSQLTIEERIMQPDGLFGEKEVVQHRILTPGAYEIRVEDPKTKEFNQIVESGKTARDEITLIPVTAFDTVPPFLTLALYAIQHYNQTSDFDSVCHLVCVPQMVKIYNEKADAEAAAKIQIASPGIGIKGWGEHFDVKYVEIQGHGLDHASARYKDIEQTMAKIGVGMLSPSDIAGIRTATEVMDTAGQRQSKLAYLTRQWQNAVEKSLFETAEYINAIKGSEVINLEDEETKVAMRIKIDYERLTFTLEQQQFYSDMVDSGKLSTLTFLEWLAMSADMPTGWTPEIEMKRLAAINTIIKDEKVPAPTNPIPDKTAK